MRHELKWLLLAASTARFFKNKLDVLIFERSREIDWEKKLTDLVSNRCHDETNSNPARSAPYSPALTKEQ